MPISNKVDRSKDLTIFSATGVLSVEEIGQAVRSFLGTAESPPTTKAIWFVEKGAISHLNLQDVKVVLEAGRPYQDSRAWAKTAIVALHDADYGVSRMIEAISSEFKGEVRVFRTIEEANTWFAEEDGLDSLEEVAGTEAGNVILANVRS